MNVKPGTPVEAFNCSKQTELKLTRAARTILSVTADAWAIPLVRAKNKVPLLASLVKDSLAVRN